MIKEFRLPDAGEGLTEAEIVSWKVKPGDVVKVNDVVVEIETAKSLVELPCPFAGTVSALLVAEGTTVDVGTPIIAVDTGGDAAPSAPPAPAAGTVSAATPSASTTAEPSAPQRQAVLVGYGPRESSLTRRARRSPGAGGVEPAEPVAHHALQEAFAQPPQPDQPLHVLAKPPVRKLARDLGVDLLTVTPTGPGGVVTREDVERSVPAASAPPDRISSAATVTGERETRIPVKGVRRWTADAMVASAFTAPHVTEWVQVDVSRSMELVERLRSDREFAGVKVSPLLLVAKAVLLSVRRNPGVNASFVGSGADAEIVVKHYVNLGIAAATPRGLVVPNIKDADRMSLRELADALAALTATAREGRTQPADLAGGTITITNVGVFGVDGGTPILNPGEAMILAVGQVRQLPWVHEGQVVPRWVTTLSVSFDHRLVDGDLGSRFLADVAAVLEDPARALVWG